jgi:hypothetical protein
VPFADQFLVAASPLLGVVADVAVQNGMARLWPGMLARSLVAGALLGAVPTLWLTNVGLASAGSSLVDRIGYNLSSFIAYAALAFGYFAVVNLCVTSVRIRVLRELYETGPSGLPRSDFLAEYNSVTILNKRLERMVKSGQIVFRDGRYYIGRAPIFRVAIVIVRAIRMVLYGMPQAPDKKR